MSTSAPTPQTAEEALPPADDTVFDFGDEEDSSSTSEDDSLLNDESTIGQASQLTLAPQHKMKHDGHGESIAKAQRKTKHDDDDDLTLTSQHKNSLFETDDDDLSLTGRRKNSLLEASGSGSGPGQTRPALGSAKASSQSAALKAARANAVSRRSLTAKKLLQAQQGKRQAEQQNLSTPPRTPHKTLKLETPDTLNTTLSSTPSPSGRGGAILTPAPASPPPPRARAYNRFFPPKKVETRDVEGTDSAVCIEPNAATGEIELHIEEKIFMTNPVASVSEELFGASKWDQIAEMAKNQLDRKGGATWSPMGDENEEAYMVADDRSVFSQKSLPSVLSNESIFHDTAVQAVASLLSLPNYSNNSPGRRSRYDEPTAHHAIPEGVSVDSDEETGSAISGLSGFSTYSSANKTRGMFEATLEATIGECDAEEDASVQSFITGELEEFIQSIPDRMITPTRQQLDMIAAIHINGDEDLVPMTTVTTRGLMIRRMNACGVLKLLASKPANRAQLAWTGGILAALTSVLKDSSFNYVDKATYNAYNMARERAVSALVCLSSDKTNRILMLHSPGLVHSLIKTVDEDDRESRLGCCVVLKDLSLAVENRRLLAQIPGLTDALFEVISGGNKDLITASLYESSPNENLHAARANAFAFFMNLTKERDNAVSPVSLLRLGGTVVTLLVRLSSISRNVSFTHIIFYLCTSLLVAPTCKEQGSCRSPRGCIQAAEFSLTRSSVGGIGPLHSVSG